MAGIVDVRSGMECYIMNIIHTCQRFAEVSYDRRRRKDAFC